MRMTLVAVALALASAGCAADEPTDSTAPAPSSSQSTSTSEPVSPDGQPMPTPTFGFATVLIDTEEGSAIIEAEKAESSEQHQFGYMFREEIGSDEGMVFLFGEERSGGFWMKNVVVPLSVAFFDEQGFIVSILDMEPCEADPCEIYAPLYEGNETSYWGALEVRQGVFQDLGVQVGDRVRVTH